MHSIDVILKSFSNTFFQIHMRNSNYSIIIVQLKIFIYGCKKDFFLNFVFELNPLTLTVEFESKAVTVEFELHRINLSSTTV